MDVEVDGDAKFVRNGEMVIKPSDLKDINCNDFTKDTHDAQMMSVGAKANASLVFDEDLLSGITTSIDKLSLDLENGNSEQLSRETVKVTNGNERAGEKSVPNCQEDPDTCKSLIAERGPIGGVPIFQNDVATQQRFNPRYGPMQNGDLYRNYMNSGIDPQPIPYFNEQHTATKFRKSSQPYIEPRVSPLANMAFPNPVSSLSQNVGRVQQPPAFTQYRNTGQNNTVGMQNPPSVSYSQEGSPPNLLYTSEGSPPEIQQQLNDMNIKVSQAMSSQQRFAPNISQQATSVTADMQNTPTSLSSALHSTLTNEKVDSMQSLNSLEENFLMLQNIEPGQTASATQGVTTTAPSNLPNVIADFRSPLVIDQTDQERKPRANRNNASGNRYGGVAYGREGTGTVDENIFNSICHRSRSPIRSLQEVIRQQNFGDVPCNTFGQGESQSDSLTMVMDILIDDLNQSPQVPQRSPIPTDSQQTARPQRELPNIDSEVHPQMQRPLPRPLAQHQTQRSPVQQQQYPTQTGQQYGLQQQGQTFSFDHQQPGNIRSFHAVSTGQIPMQRSRHSDPQFTAVQCPVSSDGSFLNDLLSEQMGVTGSMTQQFNPPFSVSTSHTTQIPGMIQSEMPPQLPPRNPNISGNANGAVNAQLHNRQMYVPGGQPNFNDTRQNTRGMPNAQNISRPPPPVPNQQMNNFHEPIMNINMNSNVSPNLAWSHHSQNGGFNHQPSQLFQPGQNVNTCFSPELQYQPEIPPPVERPPPIVPPRNSNMVNHISSQGRNPYAGDTRHISPPPPLAQSPSQGSTSTSLMPQPNVSTITTPTSLHNIIPPGSNILTTTNSSGQPVIIIQPPVTQKKERKILPKPPTSHTGGSGAVGTGATGVNDPSLTKGTPGRKPRKNATGKPPPKLVAARKKIDELPRQDLIKEDQDGDLFLHMAVCGKDSNNVKAILERLDREKLLDSVINRGNKKGQTPLYLATMLNSTNIVNILLEYNANINTIVYPSDSTGGCGREGRTAVHAACYNGKEYCKTLRALLDKSSIPAVVDCLTTSERTPLRCAIERHGMPKTGSREGTLDSRDIVKELIKHNADLSLLDSYQKTPLMYAVELAHKDLVKLILDSVPLDMAKCLIDMKDSEGNTCMRLAELLKESDQTEIWDLLHEYKNKG